MKKRGRGRLEMLEAYSDESGNSGSNIFDGDQPWFWTGTLIATGDVQRVSGPIVDDACRRLGVTELHGKVLGLPRIEIIADDLVKAFDALRAQFVFTTLEKVHLASTKFVDTVLDSDVNMGVSPMHYGFRGLRMPLTAAIVETLTTQDQAEFWEAYRTADGEAFRRILRRVDARIQALGRGRTKEILGDAFAWAIDHPTAVLDFKRSKGDAPNMVAFGLIFDGIHDLLKETKQRVTKFVHDDQKEFGREMKVWFEALRSWTGDIGAMAFMADLRRVNIIEAQFELRVSEDTAGLQLIDIVLWLYRRSLSDHLRNFPRTAELVNYVADRAILNRFSRDQLFESAEEAFNELGSIPEAQLDHEHGRRFGRKAEQSRLRRMGIDLRRI
jgi:uncharacterized protein DUF3800